MSSVQTTVHCTNFLLFSFNPPPLRGCVEPTWWFWPDLGLSEDTVSSPDPVMLSLSAPLQISVVIDCDRTLTQGQEEQVHSYVPAEEETDPSSFASAGHTHAKLPTSSREAAGVSVSTADPPQATPLVTRAAVAMFPCPVHLEASPGPPEPFLVVKDREALLLDRARIDAVGVLIHKFSGLLLCRVPTHASLLWPCRIVPWLLSVERWCMTAPARAHWMVGNSFFLLAFCAFCAFRFSAQLQHC